MLLKRFLSRFLLDLREMEGDYRVFHLKDDIAQSTLYISVAILGVLSMIRIDALLYKDSPGLLTWLVLYRGGYILISLLTIVAIRKTSKVRIYDRLTLAWLSLTILCLLVFNFTRPATLLNTTYDVIIPFAVYILSPLKIFYTFGLALSFSVGTLYVDYFHKTGVDSLTINTVLTAQLFVHVLGLASALQIQSYRRKSFKAYIQEKDAKEMVAYLANIDSLTKSLTRRQFFNIAESEFLRFSRYHRNLSMLVLDADYFKNINDTYGHYAGDLVLRNLSLVVLEQKRAQDTYGRLGGEEFGLLLPETNLEQAIIVAERVQKTWAQTPCNVDGHLIYSTVSIGVTEANSEDKSFEDVLRRADRMMYKAKETGRNRVAANE
jgi:diguanylate cyclase (GGDEF)-like protein